MKNRRNDAAVEKASVVRGPIDPPHPPQPWSLPLLPAANLTSRPQDRNDYIEVPTTVAKSRVVQKEVQMPAVSAERKEAMSIPQQMPMPMYTMPAYSYGAAPSMYGAPVTTTASGETREAPAPYAPYAPELMMSMPMPVRTGPYNELGEAPPLSSPLPLACTPQQGALRMWSSGCGRGSAPGE